ncbi:MAG TPA: hypothetical protein VFJ19_10060 [Nocardioidaceae bacterium]|nr:hypothetical protein [Nocardioidaceae bacterium]
MTETTATQPSAKPDATKAEAGKTAAEPQTPQQPASESLGDGGKKALEAEREARREAEKNLNALKSEFEGFKTSLSEAFGVKPKQGQDGDALKTVQEQLAQMQRETAVFRLAAQHHIDDPDDLDLLKSAKDETAMTKLAERLAAKAESTPGTPKPDATQGGKADPPALNSDGLEQAIKSKLGIT